MSMDKLSGAKLRIVEVGAVAGTSELLSDEVDMSGFNRVIFFGRIAAHAANNFIKGQQDTVTGMGSAADIEGSKVVTTADNEMAVLQIINPTERFVRIAIERGTSTATGDFYALQYDSKKLPQLVSVTDVLSLVSLVGPAEGTA